MSDTQEDDIDDLFDRSDWPPRHPFQDVDDEQIERWRAEKAEVDQFSFKQLVGKLVMAMVITVACLAAIVLAAQAVFG